jgi:uncharacterized membrane protein
MKIEQIMNSNFSCSKRDALTRRQHQDFFFIATSLELSSFLKDQLMLLMIIIMAYQLQIFEYKK